MPIGADDTDVVDQIIADRSRFRFQVGVYAPER